MASDTGFRISIDINAPAHRVYEVMSDIERWCEWTPSVTSIKRLDSGPFVVGSRAVIRQPKFPPALWTVTAIDGTKTPVAAESICVHGDGPDAVAVAAAIRSALDERGIDVEAFS